MRSDQTRTPSNTGTMLARQLRGVTTFVGRQVIRHHPQLAFTTTVTRAFSNGGPEEFGSIEEAREEMRELVQM